MTGVSRTPARRNHRALGWLRGLVARALGRGPASTGYRVIEPAGARVLAAGWQAAAVARRQRAAFRPILDRLREGRPREDFQALAAAFERVGVENPLIVEVGCGGAWNREVLWRLWKHPFRYIGLDYSRAMLEVARRDYPGLAFVVGDAEALPLAASSCDVLLSGTVLMHLVGYEQAIAESRRVTRRYCIFHTVPVVLGGPTRTLSKRAYGEPVPELVYNEAELNGLFERSGLAVREVFESLPYDLSGLLGEPTPSRTYLCEVG